MSMTNEDLLESIRKLHDLLNSKELTIKELNTNIDSLKILISTLRGELDSTKLELSKTNQYLSEANDTISNLTATSKDRIEQLKGLCNKMNNMQTNMSRMAERQIHIDPDGDLSMFPESKLANSILSDWISEKEEYIASLETRVTELERPECVSTIELNKEQVEDMFWEIQPTMIDKLSKDWDALLEDTVLHLTNQQLSSLRDNYTGEIPLGTKCTIEGEGSPCWELIGKQDDHYYLCHNVLRSQVIKKTKDKFTPFIETTTTTTTTTTHNKSGRILNK